MTPALGEREPGSPVLSLATSETDETFLNPDALAARLHALRGGRGLDCDPARAFPPEAEAYPVTFIWIAATATAPRRYLGFAAGPGVNTPRQLLAALARTHSARVGSSDPNGSLTAGQPNPAARHAA